MAEVEEFNRIVSVGPDPNSSYLQKFKLYQTHSNLYMVGRDKNRSFWKVLKIGREESSNLNIIEDPETYTAYECADLLKRISEGNKSCGGLKFVTNCYGIIGLTKLLGPYYMLLITKRRKIGDICGHAIYSVTKRELIPIPNNTVLSKMDISKDEKRSFVHSACKRTTLSNIVKKILSVHTLFFVSEICRIFSFGLELS